MKNVILTVSCALALLLAPPAAAQDKAQAIKEAALKEQIQKLEAAVQAQQAQNNPRFVRTLTNVQIEVTLTDQTGSAAPDKKIVSMVVSSGSWGKIRSAGTFRPVADAPFGVDLNVDARPFVSVDGPIQLELTLNYSPPGGPGSGREMPTTRTGVNQSLTVILQNGKPLIISQSADPVSDRKVVVEVKATVLK
jgi:hypothetical protein